MTLAEFKAWFEGFTETLEGQPNKKQWERIKERIAQIDGAFLTREVVYRDRYWPTYVNTHPWHSVYFGAVSQNLAGSGLSAGNQMKGAPMGAMQANQMSANAAVMDLGRADYKSLS